MSQLPRRLMYFGYYLRRMDSLRLRQFMDHVRKEKGWSATSLWWRIVRDSLKFNVSILEWYQFRFFELDDAAKSTWAGTGTMYEFQLRANPPGARELLNDKRRFYQAYRIFFRHSLWSIEELKQDPVLAERILADNERLVFKDATGNCGTSVHIQETSELSAEGLTAWMEQQGFDLVETFVQQHPVLQALSPSGVNTVRIFTLIDDQGDYRMLGCRLRISVDSTVDNLAAGNLAAPIDEETGIVCGPGVYSDITKSPESAHPVTGTSIEGFQIPHWQATLDMVMKASFLHTQNRSIGWDVVITPDGPGLIEGNHDWCKLVWQLPVARGLKAKLEV